MELLHKPDVETANVRTAPPLAVVDNTNKLGSMIWEPASHVNMVPGVAGQEHQLHVEHQRHQGQGVASVLTE